MQYKNIFSPDTQMIDKLLFFFVKRFQDNSTSIERKIL
jgi:hypothetical protein